MSYSQYPELNRSLIGYDPVDLSHDHLCRLVDQVVEEMVHPDATGPMGRPGYDPRLCIKVIVYCYAVGIRSSRMMEQACREQLPLMFLTRGPVPSYHTLSTARIAYAPEIMEVWIGMLEVARATGWRSVGHIFVDSTKIRANASKDSVINADEYEGVRQYVLELLDDTARLDEAEERENKLAPSVLDGEVRQVNTRDVLRKYRRRRKVQRRQENGVTLSEPANDNAVKPARGTGAAAEIDTAAAETAAVETAAAEQEMESAAITTTSDGGSTAEGAGAEVLPTAGMVEAAEDQPATESSLITGVPAAPGLEQGTLTTRQRSHLENIVNVIDQAQSDGLSRVSLTDPEARFIMGGVNHRFELCHSFDIAVDNALLRGSRNSNGATDVFTLEPLVEIAQQNEPTPITQVTADSGLYRSDVIARLEQSGIETCVPSPFIARDLRLRKPLGDQKRLVHGEIEMKYDAERDCYVCPQGVVLERSGIRQERHHKRIVYRSPAGSCEGCPLLEKCVKNKSKRRQVSITEDHEIDQLAQARFYDEAHQARYRQRGPQVETVFAFLRHVMGYSRWLLRGKKVAVEQLLFGLAYQLRKLQLQRKRATQGI